MKVYAVILEARDVDVIEKVFTDKEVAYKYAKLHNSRAYGRRVEEHEILNSNETKELVFVEVDYYENSSANKVVIEFKIRKLDNLDIEDRSLHRDYLHHYSKDRLEFTIRRPIAGDYDEEVLKDKYSKACYDLAAEIKNSFEEHWLEGYLKMSFRLKSEKRTD